MNPEIRHDLLTQSPATAISSAAIGAWWFNVPVEKYAAAAGLLWILLQCAYLLWKWRRDHRREVERLRIGAPPPPTTDKAAL